MMTASSGAQRRMNSLVGDIPHRTQKRFTNCADSLVNSEAQNQKDKAELRDTKTRLQQSFDRATQLARELEAERPLLVKEAKEANRLAREVNEMRLELMRLGRDKPVEEVGLKPTTASRSLV